MKNSFASLLLALALVHCGQAAPVEGLGAEAASADSEQALTPIPPHLASVARFRGYWLCEGQYFEIPGFLAAKPILATMRWSYDVDGAWLRGDFAERKTAQNPTPFISTEYVSVEAETSSVIRLSVGNKVDRLQASAPVPAGDVFFFTGTISQSGAVLPFTDEVEFHGANVFTTKGAFDLGAGPVNYAELTCYKLF